MLVPRAGPGGVFLLTFSVPTGLLCRLGRRFSTGVMLSFAKLSTYRVVYEESNPENTTRGSE
jgi:hypothetical protein